MFLRIVVVFLRSFFLFSRGAFFFFSRGVFSFLTQSRRVFGVSFFLSSRKAAESLEFPFFFPHAELQSLWSFLFSFLTQSRRVFGDSFFFSFRRVLEGREFLEKPLKLCASACGKKRALRAAKKPLCVGKIGLYRLFYALVSPPKRRRVFGVSSQVSLSLRLCVRQGKSLRVASKVSGWAR
ncbi:hypothetical protein HMPREF9136_1423 [Prevotella dentalis DSM 3688]|uniref:Uncharacterized protein n=1 Tax=Prevotella dentalis (strain ATCC 49559 / DSM 3688 / JCM 13448 / NCTC 12043 / ES 2772) TaxID=908937 RepID=F9D3J5_PREDD|nr:hypothetical protein HMPREF9136_1423 [Prevotella dentalis DSM 3688]